MTTGDATPMVRFEKVTKRYGNLTVIDGLDLSIGRGEKVAMIGLSGSGKTTVLRMLMTLERIDGAESASHALGQLRQLGIAWYVVVGDEGPRWDRERRRAAFLEGRVAVYSTRGP